MNSPLLGKFMAGQITAGEYFSYVFADLISSPGRILGLFFILATLVLFIIKERKAKKERQARRLARQQEEANAVLTETTVETPTKGKKKKA